MYTRTLAQRNNWRDYSEEGMSPLGRKEPLKAGWETSLDETQNDVVVGRLRAKRPGRIEA